MDHARAGWFGEIPFIRKAYYNHNVRESNGSALIYAARYGRLSTARNAIELGEADPNLIAANQTVLSHAAETGHAEICEVFTAVVDVLLADAPELKVNGCYTNPGNNEVPFLAAITYRRESIALKLLDRGADPCVPLRGRAPHNTSAVAKFSAQTLGTLIDGSQLRVLERLLMWEGPQPNLLDPNAVWGDRTPLLTAVYNNSEEAVKLLLEDPRVDVNLITPTEQMTALMAAELGEYRSIADLLLAHGADPDLPDCTGMTPRMIHERPGKPGSGVRAEHSEKLQAFKEARNDALKSTSRDRVEAIRARMRARRAASAAEQQDRSSSQAE
ncbi:hypothetical protein APSETT445_009564 [Aspergillus pseudonomiae]